ncbi:MAG TPA: carbohydrate binding domain-containing protein [Pyrinomonadaceae bacterium]|nr:carbohydrate binding domain-containing protein [Pyrinomonadaceae bacterium]
MRIAVSILAITLCLFLMQAAGRIGLSRLLARYALIADSIQAADEAARLSPSDPEIHRARAAVATHLQMHAEAVSSLEIASRLRQRDDVLWLELGNAREEVGDTKGALAALDQAVRWAPYYAHTHWQRGNLLLRMERLDEAFAELRTAAAANRNYLPNLIDLAWGISKGDVDRTEELIALKDDDQRVAFIQFLTQKRQFRGAYNLWSTVADVRQPHLFNGGFEEPLVFDGVELGRWVFANDHKNKLAIDVSQKFTGTRSFQITFDGDWNPGTPLLSQTVLVDPSKTYRVSFTLKTKDLVTGGPPLFTVSDATTNQLLGKSENFPSTESWRMLSFTFTSLATTEAAVIRLRRNNCDESPCPIFGVLWLDEINIQSADSSNPER